MKQDHYLWNYTNYYTLSMKLDLVPKHYLWNMTKN